MKKYYIDYSKLSRTDKLKKIEELRLIFLKELNEDIKYIEFFKEYNDISVNKFKEMWAKKKAEHIVEGSSYNKVVINYDAETLECANNMIWYIQQEKLFKAQCLWRAKQITIPDVYIANEFLFYWSQNIKNCTFITPITESELYQFIEFIKSDYCTELKSNEYYLNFQDYDDVKKYAKYVRESEFNKSAKPKDYDFDEWDIEDYYKYLFNIKGIPDYINLPDLKGDKEHEYIRAVFKNEEKDDEYDYNKPVKEILSPYNSETKLNFIKEFENNKLLNYHIAYRHFHDTYIDDYTMLNIWGLEDAKEIVGVEANNDWKKGIKLAYLNYKKQKLIAALPKVYRRIKNTKTKTKLNNDKELQESNRIRRNRILKGRKLNREPENFDY